MPGYRHFLPMKVKVGRTDDFLPDGEELAGCRIIFRLQKDQGRAVFADSGRLFAGFVSGDGEFFNACQAAVCCGNPCARGLAAPEREKIQPWEGEVLSPPGDINADDVDLSAGEFGKTGDQVEKMLKAADVTRSGVVLPSVNVNEKEW